LIKNSMTPEKESLTLMVMLEIKKRICVTSPPLKRKKVKKCKSMLIRGDEGERRCTMKEDHDSLFSLPRTDGMRPVQYPVRAQDWL
jgi:RNase P subunit RPR2